MPKIAQWDADEMKESLRMRSINTELEHTCICNFSERENLPRREGNTPSHEGFVQSGLSLVLLER